MEIILEKVKIIAFEKRITLAEIERRAELSNGTIARWNKATPRIDSVVKVADVLGVSLDYLVKGIDNNSNCNNKTNSSIIGNDNSNNTFNFINGELENNTLSKQEQMIIDIYRKIDAIKQMEVFQKILEMSKHIEKYE